MTDDLKFRVKTKLPVLGKQRFYDETFLDGDGGPVLFILDAAVVESKRGRQVRVKRDILHFKSVGKMGSALLAGGWREAPVEDRSWRPSLDDIIGIEVSEEVIGE